MDRKMGRYEKYIIYLMSTTVEIVLIKDLSLD